MELKVIAAASVLETALFLPKAEQLGMLSAKIWLGLCLAQYMLVKIYDIFIYPHFFSPLRHLPGPKDNHFFIGQTARHMMASSPHALYEEWARKWPDAPFIRELGIANKEQLVVNSLAAQRECLGIHGSDFIKSRFQARLLSGLIPGGLVLAEGEEHRRRKKALAGLMSLSSVRKMVPVFQEKARGFVAAMQSDLDACGDDIWEVEPALQLVLLDIIGVTSLGVELAEIESSSPMGFSEAYNHVLQPSGIGAALFFLNATIPLRWLPIESNRVWLKASATVHDMLRGVVRKRAEDLKAATRDGTARMEKLHDRHLDLTTCMLEGSISKEGGLTETEIACHLFEIVAAGHDTSTSALTWAIYELAAKPEVQDQCRAEILAAVQEIDRGMLENLGFLESVLKEVLRIYPPTASTSREAVKDLIIEGVPIAKGTTIVLSTANIGRNPRVWGPDADLFNPDRWARLEGDAASPYAFAAFTNGLHMCLGKQQAMLQMKAILCELLRVFHFEPVDTVPTFQQPALILKPKDPLRVRLRRLAL